MEVNLNVAFPEKLCDFYGTWYVNAQKQLGHDSKKLSGCKKNSYTHGFRSKMTDHRK